MGRLARAWRTAALPRPLLAALALTLLLGAQTAAAQGSSTLQVANTGQSEDTFGNFGTSRDFAQKFTVGSNSGGYKLTRVDVRLKRASGFFPAYTVTVRADSSGSPASTTLGTLTNALWPTSWGLVTFSASGNGISLDASTDYWLVIDVSNGQNGQVRLTNSGSEDDGAASGWSINNACHHRSSDSGSWTSLAKPMQLAVYGTAESSPADTTAPAFSSAEVNGTALSVTFDETLDTSSLPAGSVFTVSGGRTGTGTVSVNGAVASVTLDGAVAHGETVTVSYAKGSDANPLRDAAENEVADFSGEAVTTNTPETPLVANTGQSEDTFGNFSTDRDFAQKFRAGSNSGGYKLTRVDVRLQTALKGQPTYTVTIRTDSSGSPASTTLGTLTNALWPTSWGLVTFSASGDGISLDPNTDYWLVIDVSNGRDSQVRLTNSGSEDDGAGAGWRIDNNTHHRSGDSGSWTSLANPMQLAVYGTAESSPADSTAPAFFSAEVNGTALAVTFSENLDTGSLPAGSVFTVSGGRTGTGTVSVSDATASVTLNGAVTTGETVTVSYTKPSTNPLRDAAENAVETFSGKAVTNNTLEPLVANTRLDHNSFGHFETSRDFAQQFTTGGHPGGYRLTRVDVRLKTGVSGEQPSYTVTIRGDSSGSPGATSLGTLANADWPASWGLVTFSASGSGIHLARYTDYWLVIDVTNGRNGVVRRRITDTEDSGAAAGWSIGNSNRYRADDSSSWTGQSHSIQLAVYGNAVGAAPVVSIAGGSAVTEGGSASFTVTADPAPTANLTVDLTIAQTGGFVAAAGLGSKTVTVPTSGSATYTVATVNDSNDEASGSVTATVGTGTGSYRVHATNNEASVTVNDDDDPATPVVSISGSGGVAVDEGGVATFTVTSSPPPAAVLTVNLTIGQEGSFVAAGHLGSKTVMVPTSGSATYTVATVNDSNDEASGSVTAWVGTGTGYDVHPVLGGGRVRVNDNDDPPSGTPVVEIGGPGAIREGRTGVFRLAADPAPASALTVNLIVSQAGDFVNAGELGSKTATVGTSGSATYTVATVNDSVDEPYGAVKVELASGTGYGLHNSHSVAYASVLDDDDPPDGAPIVSIEAGSAVDEGGVASFTVTASPAPASALTVNLIVTQEGDFVASPNLGSKTVTVGTSGSATYTVATVNDSSDEASGEVTVSVGPGTGYHVQDWGAWGYVTVRDNDNPPAGTPEVSIEGGSAVDEGGSASFTVTAMPAPASSITVNLTIGQTGSFVAAGELGSKTVTVGTSGSATYTVATVNDNNDEASGSVTAWVRTGTGYSVHATDDEASVTVNDNDDPPAGTPEVSIEGGSAVTEGGSASFTVTAMPAPASSITVNLTIGQEGDFVAAGELGSKTVTVGTSGSATYTVATVNDNNDEASGSVTAWVGPGTGYSVHNTQSVASVTVNDNDDPPPATPVVSIAGGSAVTEGGSASFTVTAMPAPASSITVNLTIGQEGDFVAAGELGSKTVTVGTSGSATYTVATVNDSNDEASGSVTATVGTGTGYSVHNTQSVASVTVNDNDDPPDSPQPPDDGGTPPGGGEEEPRTTVPDAPRNLRAVGGYGEVVLTWEAPASDGGAAITDFEYRIERSPPWISTGSTDTTHTVSGLDSGTTYVFEVRAVNRVGNSSASNRAEATPKVPEVLDFSHFANGDGIASDLVFVNVGTQPVRPALYFYDTEGSPIAAESMVDMEGDLEVAEDGALTSRTGIETLGELTVSTHGRGALVTGSVKVLSEDSIGGMLRYILPHIGEAIVGASAATSDAIFPVRRRRGGINTGVAIHNLESTEAQVDCELLREGVPLDAVSITLAANGQTAWSIDQAFSAADTSEFSGSVRCTAVGDGQFSAIALEMDSNNRIFATLPVMEVSQPYADPATWATTLNFSHFANGASILSELVLVNLETRSSGPPLTPFGRAIPPTRPAIYFYDSEGQPILPETVVDIGGDVEVTEDGGLALPTGMEPLGELTISTHGWGSLVTGSVKVVSEGPIGGMLRYDLPHVGEAVVGASAATSDVIFPVRRQQGGINTGVAIHNLESTEAVVDCELLRGGVLLDAVSIALAANGQTSWSIDEAFTAADTSEFSGSMRCTAVGDGRFTAIALEMDSDTRIFTTLPVVEVEERMSLE